MFELVDESQHLPTVAALATAARFSLWVAAYNVSGARSTACPAYAALWAALLALPGRRADCRMLLPHPAISTRQNPPERTSLKELTGAGWRIKTAPPGRLQHSKAWIQDGRSAILTSANLSETALTKNHEHLLLGHGAAVCLPLTRRFVALWTAAHPLDLQ